MDAIRTDAQGKKIMAPKMLFRAYKIEGISSYAANIIKQHLLSLGSDAALSRDCLVKKMNTDIIIFGTVSQLARFIEKIRCQPFGLKEVACTLDMFLKTDDEKSVFYARDKKLLIGDPALCGILNVTPDSFSGDGLLGGDRLNLEKNTLTKVAGMVKNGTKIIDIGGESTRPFSKPVSEREEIARVIPLLRVIRRKFPKLIISIDTYKYKVAKAAVDEGADIINDITALRHSPRIAGLIKRYRLGCILMHMKGTPRSMQKKPRYGDVVDEIKSFLKNRIDFCREHGINKNQLMVDPGVGFGKRVRDNVEIISRLWEFKTLGVPIFLGVSRKSFIGGVLDAGVDERLSGTLASCLVSVINGADVLRVHDVREVNHAVRMAKTLMNQ